MSSLAVNMTQSEIVEHLLEAAAFLGLSLSLCSPSPSPPLPLLSIYSYGQQLIP